MSKAMIVMCGKMHYPYGFILAASAWAGNTCDRNGYVRMSVFKRTLRHGYGDFFANGSMRIYKIHVDA